jgi:hypothetical protein
MILSKKGFAIAEKDEVEDATMDVGGARKGFRPSVHWA